MKPERGVLSNVYVRFVLVGLLNTAFGYSLFLVILQAPLPLFVVVALSNVGAILFNFWTMGTLVFDNADPRLIFRFVTGWGFYIGLAYVGLRAMIALGVPVEFAPAVLLLPMAVVSFLINRFFIFKKLA